MEKEINRCVLLPIDGSDESLRPVGFLSLLYGGRTDFDLIITYFKSPLPPIYQQTLDSAAMVKKKRQLLRYQQREIQTAFSKAREALISAGFPAESIREQTHEKQMSVAKHACMLANIQKVDAVVVQRKVSSSLEGFLKGDPTQAMLRHCLGSPVWICEGNPEPSHAVICVHTGEFSLRSVDHAAFMLAVTETKITLLHITSSVDEPLTATGFDHDPRIEEWLATDKGEEMRPWMEKSIAVIRNMGINEDRVETVIYPGRGSPSNEILEFCRNKEAGIAAIGHSGSRGGIWGFWKGSVTKQILADSRNLSVWISQ
jgi:nucleotide-binding universal stress UspA family protein